ncbi:MAG: Mur ligase domain-containing protein [Kiritimatiellae bacterium]|nr:Mur ligase domain-containing protein [Kiritimatiellia bacterium]
MKRHLIGIGGVGMSALATALLRLGDVVTGQDRTLGTKNIRFLESLGVKVSGDDGSLIDSTTDEVIVSTAIEETNPGLVKAKELGIKVTHRAAALSKALESYKLVAVVGTCGKSTVTAMLGHILDEAGLDPMCVNGANVPGWEGAVRFGKGAYAVAEVDESDKSLVAFRPYAAIVTNASADHYSKEEMDEVFDAFIKDCPGPVIDARGETYRPQDYNLQNASLAIRMAVKLGVDEAKAKGAMETFRGVERRLQKYSDRVYDDYAHNPEKLRSMIETLKEKAKKGLCVIWRPHGYAPLRKMMEALAEMFNETMRPQDKLLLLPVYDAGGTTDRSVNSSDLIARIEGVGPRCRCTLVKDLDEAYENVKANKQDFDVVVTAGARDPGLPDLAKRIGEL